MTELNKDGLAIGEPVSFEDMQRIQREHYKKGRINVGKKRSVRKSRKPGVSNVSKAEETEKAETAAGLEGFS
jgi:hypothetical protein